MRCMVVLLTAAACFSQSKVNVGQARLVDAYGANRLPPTSTFASPPSSPPSGAVYIFTDASAVGACSGGGSSLATCRWSDSAWQVVGGSGSGGGGSDSSIFSGGTQVQRLMQCAHGTVPYTTLTTASASQEIAIQTGISGNVRWDQVMVNPTTPFTGGTATLPTVSMGRTGSNNFEMTGVQVPIGSGGTPWTARPIPPQLTGTYSVVLNFAVTTGNVNAFNAGSLDWEICGYAAR